MEIRDASSADYDAIREVVGRAFGEVAEVQLVEGLRNSGDAVVELVADMNGTINGHVMVSKLASPEGGVAIAPVSVQPEEQDSGIGSALVRQAIDRAKADGWKAMFLLGEPEFYSPFGFSIEACERFDSMFPKEYMMALELQDGALAELEANIVYADLFAELFGAED